jgi:hypothetical protein
MDPRLRVIDRLEKLIDRADWSDPARIPSGECRDVTTHLAGMFIKTHYRLILEALKRMD